MWRRQRKTHETAAHARRWHGEQAREDVPAMFPQRGTERTPSAVYMPQSIICRRVRKHNKE